MLVHSSLLAIGSLDSSTQPLLNDHVHYRVTQKEWTNFMKLYSIKKYLKIPTKSQVLNW